MQGTPNAERMMKIAKKYMVIKKEDYNRAYTICMDMKIVYANEFEESKVLITKLREQGFKSHNNK